MMALRGFALVFLSLCAVLLLVCGIALAARVYPDRVGDVRGGLGPDIASIAVSNTRTATASKARDSLQLAASSCIRLPGSRDGKEGVDGSSPSEGSVKSAARPRFRVQSDLLAVERAVGLEPFMELSHQKSPGLRF